jgi:hypothetical protein
MNETHHNYSDYGQFYDIEIEKYTDSNYIYDFHNVYNNEHVIDIYTKYMEDDSILCNNNVYEIDYYNNMNTNANVNLNERVFEISTFIAFVYCIYLIIHKIGY